MSYSHADEALRDKLEKHLSLMKRQGLISTWHDRKILAGDKFKSEIDSNLEDSNIILLLISPDFIASHYCYDIEMKRALELDEEGKARVIPIILEHCDWQAAQFGELLALPEDGRPVTDFPNQNKALSEIAKELRRILTSANQNSKSEPVIVQQLTSPTKSDFPKGSSNLRIEKRFTAKENDKFIRESFEYIQSYFKNSLIELKKRNKFIDYNITQVDANTFTVKLYSNDNRISQCKIWLSSDFGSTETIKYSSTINSINSFNEIVTVKNDGYKQFLAPSGMLRIFNNSNENNKLSAEGVSELFWGQLIQQLQ